MKCTSSPSGCFANLGPLLGEVSTAGTAPKMLRTLVLVDFSQTRADSANAESGRVTVFSEPAVLRSLFRYAGDVAPVMSGTRPTTRVGPRNLRMFWL